MTKTNKKSGLDGTQENQSIISEGVANALQVYFADLDGHDTHGLYDLVLSQVEKPLLVAVMQHTNNNITRAAVMLGINRATLSKKLKKYDL